MLPACFACTRINYIQRFNPNHQLRPGLLVDCTWAKLGEIASEHIKMGSVENKGNILVCSLTRIFGFARVYV